jgi:hypothetical protein
MMSRVHKLANRINAGDFQFGTSHERTMEEVFAFLSLASELEEKNKIEAATKVGVTFVVFYLVWCWLRRTPPLVTKSLMQFTIVLSSSRNSTMRRFT